MFTYGDGLADIDINKLIKFHKEKIKKLLLFRAVRPNARFGELLIEENFVNKFSEKPQTKMAGSMVDFLYASLKFLIL